MQGYACPRTPEFEALVPWLRFSPALCSFVGAVGTATASGPLLTGLAAVAALGALSPVHPFDRLYNRVVRRFTGTDPLPPNGAPRRFACAVAAVWLLVTATAFRRGSRRAGYGLGAAFVATSGLVATTHVCIPSMVYRTVFRKSVEESA